MKNFGIILAAILGIILIAILGSIYSGFVLSTMWGWFVVSTFNAPQLSIPVAIGIAVIVRWLTHEIDVNKDSEKDYGVTIAVQFLIPTIVLIVGWIVQMFV